MREQQDPLHCIYQPLICSCLRMNRDGLQLPGCEWHLYCWHSLCACLSVFLPPPSALNTNETACRPCPAPSALWLKRNQSTLQSFSKGPLSNRSLTCLTVCQGIYDLVPHSVCLSMAACLPISLSVCMSVCLSVCPFVCLYCVDIKYTPPFISQLVAQVTGPLAWMTCSGGCPHFEHTPLEIIPQMSGWLHLVITRASVVQGYIVLSPPC